MAQSRWFLRPSVSQNILAFVVTIGLFLLVCMLMWWLLDVGR